MVVRTRDEEVPTYGMFWDMLAVIDAQTVAPLRDSSPARRAA